MSCILKSDGVNCLDVLCEHDVIVTKYNLMTIGCDLPPGTRSALGRSADECVEYL